MKERTEKTYKIEEFEKMIVGELEKLKENKPIRVGTLSPISKQRNLSKTGMKASPESKSKPRADGQLKNKTTPVFQSSDYSSFKKLEKEAKKGFFDKSVDAKKNILKDSRSNITIPNMNIEEDKENNPQINIIEDQEEIKINNKKNLKKQPVANKDSKDEEEYKFMPKLSKNSLLIASGLGDPLERLTAKKKTNRKPRKNNRDELTFTPKINTKSTIIDNSRRDKSMNRFQELHEQAQQLQYKREKLVKEAEQDKSTKENQACVFQPQLVSSYTPEYLNEMSFLERSYMWKRRIEQKLENQRKQKEEPDTITTAIRTSTPQINSSAQRISVSTELTDFFNINPKTSNLDQRKPAGKNLY